MMAVKELMREEVQQHGDQKQEPSVEFTIIQAEERSA